MKILAFGHQKRVGKDTACRFALTHIRSSNLVRHVEKRGFADKVKSVTHDLYKWAGLESGSFYEEAQNEHLREVVLPLIGKTPRQIWISFGNEVKAATYRDTWIDYLLHSVKCDFLIISDLRFPNEAEKIKSMGGKVIKICRPSVPHTSDAADDPLLNYDGWDNIIYNLEIDQFYKDVCSTVDDILREVKC
jgi:hypothetical protein